MKLMKNIQLVALFVFLTIAQSLEITFAQKPEEITRGLPWFIGMIVLVIIVAVAAGLRQKKK